MSDEDNRQDNWPMGWTLQEIKEHIDALEAQVRELQVKVDELTKTLELIGKNMEYDPWMHTLIKEVIGYEKVIE